MIVANTSVFERHWRTEPPMEELENVSKELGGSATLSVEI
jgi:hypothetical protein